MKAFKLLSLVIVATIILTACVSPTPAPPPTSAPAPAAQPTAAAPAAKAAKDIKILVNMKGPGGGNPFWAAVEKGALDAGKALGVQVSVMAPPAESDVAAQIAQIEDALTKGIDGLALAQTEIGRASCRERV